jgi:hypothetical protein
MATPLRPMPADFPQVAPGKSIRWLARHYSARNEVIMRFFEESGALRLYQVPSVRKPVPDDFAEFAPIESSRELTVRYETSSDTVARWRREKGIPAPHFVHTEETKPKRHYRRAVEQRLSIVMDNRDGSEASRAQSWLQRFYPVWRCDPEGTFNPKGTHFRCDGIIRTSDEMIERAKRKGFDQDEWRRAA